ncbi:MAG: acyltransferase [Clostridia bacterium]|nr:acyltransferase [Clostridia bacterium]
MNISNAIKYYKNQKRVNALRKKGAKIGENVIICEGAHFDEPQNLVIEDNVYLGNNFYANCAGGLTIRTGTLISYNCTIMTYNHDYNEPLFMPYGLSNVYKPVEIKDHVWIGINVSVNSGVTIGENAIIGMGTTVPKSVPENSIYAGGRIIKEREPKEVKYDLLEVRAPYKPSNYRMFKKIMNRIKENKVLFSKVSSEYKNKDIYNMIRIWASENQYEVDWKEEFLEKK